MPDKPANSPAGPQEGTRTKAGAAAGTEARVPSAPKVDVAHLRWMAEHAGGDTLADVNSWNRVKSDLAALLDVAEAARGFWHDVANCGDSAPCCEHAENDDGKVLSERLARLDFSGVA